jgi:glyoxylase-like metal-dependent hydrolase (beta-lactamase superfamily II)
MKRRFRLGAWLGLLAAARVAAATVTVGAVLPPPDPGGMDIHHINTGEGNAALLVLPDQTTFLIDCGSGQDSTRPPQFKAPRRPDESRLPGEWVARYVQSVHPRGPGAPGDYALATHFHADHMGGFMEFLARVPVRIFLDRGWPDYGPPLPFGGALAGRYKGALAEQVRTRGMRVERFRAGVADQIVLQHGPRQFPGFEIRNLAVNGAAWTGEGTTMRQRTADTEKNENALCAALRVRYGAFDYFTGGDLTGTPDKPGVPWSHDVESAVAWATGPVDVAVLNHHGNSDSTTPFFVSVLQPRVCIANIWDAQQLDPTTLGRLRSEAIGPGPRDIFMTNGGWPGRAEHIVRLFGETVGRKHLEDLKSVVQQGHVVVRVAPGGGTYQVIVLTDADESRRVVSVHGPYTAK